MRSLLTATTAMSVLAAALFLNLAPPAAAATPAPSPTAAASAAPVGADSAVLAAVSWSVEPAGEDGEPTGKPWAEYTLDPGERVEGYMRVTNRGGQRATFALSAADGYFTDSGRFSMLPADKTSVDAGTWITLADSVSIDPSASAVVPFVLAVPAHATPGDHLAGVAAGVYSERERVAVESRIGFRVMTRVGGQLAPAVASTVSADYASSWNPFLPGRLTVVSTTTNSGNTRLAVRQSVAAAGPFGVASQSAPDRPLPEMAPGDVRETTTVIDDVWPIFATTALVRTSATDASETAGAESQAIVATVPWSQLVVLAAIAILVFFAHRDRLRRRRRWEQKVEQARREGLHAAQLGAALTLLVAWGLGMPLMLASPAEASVIVDVDITPRPTATPASVTGPDVVATLAKTGTAAPEMLMVGGAGVVLVGGALVLLHTARGRRRADPAAEVRRQGA
ncbi:hypothetical protein SAMN04487788_0744 [Microbacterium testaceum StLB037]|uniref:DUF916 domain-containing protein n=1 Tax=Microbacterium testaceum (strain StLB037) TaxID=979556 RepID=A0A1H0M6H8_MICTS|nr:hypothetical protein [Microbacterium testaceum]SDO75816.1 hypothetical protein SAMN04487788_0744 [Microbacterium testaceum StLB037]